MSKNYGYNSDDEFLTALSRGTDPSDGSDQLAALFLELRDDVERPAPEAPQLDGVAEVASLDTRRRNKMNPWAAGLIGAAASAAVVAGVGTMVAPKPVDTVEFASALDEIEVKTENGDIEGARALIEELRAKLANERSGKDKNRDDEPVKDAPVAPVPGGKETVTVTAEPKKEGERPAKTVTVTPEPVTETVTVTESAPAPAAKPSSSSTASPSSETPAAAPSSENS